MRLPAWARGETVVNLPALKRPPVAVGAGQGGELSVARLVSSDTVASPLTNSSRSGSTQRSWTGPAPPAPPPVPAGSPRPRCRSGPAPALPGAPAPASAAGRARARAARRARPAAVRRARSPLSRDARPRSPLPRDARPVGAAGAPVVRRSGAPVARRSGAPVARRSASPLPVAPAPPLPPAPPSGPAFFGPQAAPAPARPARTPPTLVAYWIHSSITKPGFDPALQERPRRAWSRKIRIAIAAIPPCAPRHMTG